MTFVLQDVIKELEGSHSLEPLKKLKKENLAKVTAKRSHILDLSEEYCINNDTIENLSMNVISARKSLKGS